MPRAARLSLALVVMLALMAAAGLGLASGGINPTGVLQGVTVQPGENSAVVTWTVNDVPAKVSVEYGVDERYGVWSDTTAVLSPRSGQTVLTGLEPGTDLQVPHPGRLARVAPGDDGLVRHLRRTGIPHGPHWARLRSPRPSSSLFKNAPAVQSVTNLTIDGSPIFPRMVWRQCAGTYPDSLAAGINVFHRARPACRRWRG